MFTFCPLQGALSGASASQSLLELDGGIKVLVDVGWDESFDVKKLKELEKHVSTLSLILLTHATVSHLGAFAHCSKHIPLFTRIPVYATQPVIDLGRSLTQELYASAPQAATLVSAQTLPNGAYNQVAIPSDKTFLLQAPTPDEIVRYFAAIQPLKYSQSHQPLASPFSPPLNGLTITAYNAGHTLGGSIWHVQHGLESIVYAVDWNNIRENVFAGAAWLGGRGGGGGGSHGTEVVEQLRKPTALICSAHTPETSLSLSRRDEQLLENLKLCVNRGGTVLIPVDSTARVLELAYLLERAWREDGPEGRHGGELRAARLFLAGRNVKSTMRLTRSMLEWMNEGIVREFEAGTNTDGGKKVNGQADGPGGKNGSPFEFRHLRLLEKKGQVDKVLARPEDEAERKGTVILASDESLGWGFSKDVLRAIAADPRNLVILPQRPSSDQGHSSLAQQLWEWWKERRDGVATEQTGSGDAFEQVYGGGRILSIPDATKQPLEGDELEQYQQWLATQRQLQSSLAGGTGADMEATADDVVDDDDASSDSSSDSEDSDNEQQGKVLNVSAQMGQANRKKVVLRDEELGVAILIKKRGVYDYDVRGKKGRERMFPVAIRRRRNDEFGELIRPDDFLRAEEKVVDGEEVNGSNTRPGEGGGLGKKRKFDDVMASGRNAGNGANKRPQLERHVSEDDLPRALSGHDGPNDELDAIGDDVQEPEGPSKLVVTSTETKANLRIAFVDFSGLHDKRNLNMLIPLIQPRKLILVAGTQAETETLANDSKDLLAQKIGTAFGDTAALEVLTPAVGVRVDASVDTNAWVVKLGEGVVKGLKWQNVRGLGVVTVSGLLLAGRPMEQEGQGSSNSKTAADEVPDEEGGPNKRQRTAASGKDNNNNTISTTLSRDDNNAALPVLDSMPNTGAASLSLGVRNAAAHPFHVGDIRLTDVRRAMQSAGHTAEFRGEGILLVDGSVAVRKSTTGRIEVESVGLPTAEGGRAAALRMGGGGSGTFYAVRKVIYDGLAVVAGA